MTNYLVLGRALYYVPYLSPLHPGRVISTFVGIDVIVGILTGNGASEVNPSNSAKTQRIGRGLIRTSILLQVFSFLGFVTLTVIFHRRCLRANIFNSKLRAIIFLLYVSSVMISIRHIYRVVEVFEGYGGYVYAHEVFFYIFDATVMLLNAIMLNVFHPMAYLPRFNKTYLAKDGVTELEGPGWVDNRSFFITFLDPFDIGGLITGRDKKIDKFWETEELQHQDSLKAGKQVSVRGGQC